MDGDLRAKLQSLFGDTYIIERELGGGGMSRVFVAEETRLHRRVVIKVLDPQPGTGMLADRFERELRFAAGLQHPQIVPVLSAGELDGLPFYTMPYVDGPSLRARLVDASSVGKRLDLSVSLSILLDVARALVYAHAHGIVHRDIKPENVLLSGDAALVTDFGIAKALEAARTNAAPGAAAELHGMPGTALTQVGTAIGTPAYMAPEQVGGDAIDARTDVYAWGMVAYEMFAGRHPFARRSTAQQLLAAQLGEMPPSLDSVVKELPTALASLVMRCLAKQPEARPSSADELVATLRAYQTGSGNSIAGRTRRGRRLRMASAVLVVLIALATGGWLLTPADARATLRTLITRPPPTLRVNRVVVAAFKNETGDPKLTSLGALTADYLTEGLSRLASLEVVDAGTASQTSEVVQRIPRFLRRGDERSLGEETGAKVVVGGSYYLLGDSVVFRARILDAGTGAIRAALEPVSVLARTPTAGIATVSRRVVAALRAASDEDASDLAGLSPPPSIEAYEAFRQGYQGFLHGRADSADFSPLRRAMALDSTYAAPAVAFAFFCPDRLAAAACDSALTHAGTFRDRLSAQERALVDMTEARASGDFAAYMEESRRTGIQQLVAGAAMLARRPRVAMAALRATDPDRGINIPTASNYWLHLAAAYAQVGDYDRALAAVREGERRVPAFRERHYSLVIAAARGDVQTVRDGLDAIQRAGEPVLVPVVLTTALLRMHAGREAEGAALAATWADRIVGALAADSSVDSGFELALADLMASVGRWQEVLRYADLAQRRFDARLRGGEVSSWWRGDRALILAPLRRAVALSHLGRAGEALAIDSALARAEDRRWNDGLYSLGRGIIAAHLGDHDRAIALVERGVSRGGLSFLGSSMALMTLDDIVLLLPLRDDPRYRALAGPDPADRP